MDLKNLIYSRMGVDLALGLAKILPERAGYWLGRTGGAWFAGQRNQDIVRAVRANQWVVTGETLSAQQLDQRVRATFLHAGRCIYDFYHLLQDPQAMSRKVVFSPDLEQAYQDWKANRYGVILVGPHMSNFDMVICVMAWRGLPIQLLSYPAPPGSYQAQNALRQEIGLEVTPLSASSLRQATARLQAGGIVMTGLDRPAPDTKYQPRFFGKPSAATTAYIRLALKTGCPVIVLGNQMRPDGTCLVQASEPIQMQPHADLETEIVQNAERVLEWGQRFICEAPEQWLMYYPVWPDALASVP